MRRLAYVVVAMSALLALCGAIAAQAPGEAPKPGPEVQKLAYFVGAWKFEGESKPSEFGPGGKFGGEETCEWFAGGFQVVCRSSETSAMGTAKGMSVMAYDPEARNYTFYMISSRGESVFGKGEFAGATLNTSWEGTIKGKPAKVRGAMAQESPTGYSFKMEISLGGGPWVVVGEGKETKIK